MMNNLKTQLNHITGGRLNDEELEDLVLFVKNREQSLTKSLLAEMEEKMLLSADDLIEISKGLKSQGQVEVYKRTLAKQLQTLQTIRQERLGTKEE